ncbi:MAG TPA: alpha-hydroxy acid oxidase [Rhizomicrobium sp.]|nr:alpha-hydroxy acid oxidase [Rhizomicrobium sp.]
MHLTLRQKLGATHSIDDLRDAARRRLPRMLFDFMDGGAQTESTVRENRAALERIRLVPSALAGVATRSQGLDLFGAKSTMPLIIGPTGFAAGFWARGDVALARAAAKQGIPFVISMSSGSTLEDIGHAAPGTHWFQHYMPRDRERTKRLLPKLRDHGVDLIEVTVDTILPGRRLRDIRNGFSSPIVWTPRKVASVLAHPDWLVRTGRHGIPRMAIIEGESHAKKAANLSEVMRPHFDEALSWDDIKWLRDQWPGKLLLKGVSDPRQLRPTMAAGLDGIVISNHGGRQLDGAIATIDILPEFVRETGGRFPLLIDGGFRTGTDIVKALALGATAVQVGRATLYGLATAGEAGVSYALAILRAEIDLALAFCGIGDLTQLGRDSVRVASRYAIPDEIVVRPAGPKLVSG